MLVSFFLWLGGWRSGLFQVSGFYSRAKVCGPSNGKALWAGYDVGGGTQAVMETWRPRAPVIRLRTALMNQNRWDSSTWGTYMIQGP